MFSGRRSIKSWNRGIEEPLSCLIGKRINQFQAHFTSVLNFSAEGTDEIIAQGFIPGTKAVIKNPKCR